MTTSSLAQPAHLPTRNLEHVSGIAVRVLRGQELYRDHADEITYMDGVWHVPSQHEGTSVYEVLLGRHEACECSDFEYRGYTCKHIYAAAVARAKTALCAMCGKRFRYRELHEVDEDHLTCFPGDLLCTECAADHGVL